MFEQRKIAVIGCGVSGMAAAFELSKYGFNIEVFEKEKRIGGRMGTADLAGRRVCLGGKNIGKTYRRFRQFCDEMGVNDFEEFGLNSSSGKGENSRTFDGDKFLSSALNFAKGLPLKDISRLLAIVYAVKKDTSNMYLSGEYCQRKQKSKYGSETISSYFSKTLSNRMLRPLIVRNNAAEPDEISLESFNTNIAMILDSYEQLRHGPDELFERFSERITVHNETNISGVVLEDKAVTGIATGDGEVHHFDAVILATPAYASAGILANALPDLASILETIRYFPVAIVVSRYETPFFNDDKRAWTFPQESVLSNAGCYGKNDLDLVRYTFSGRKARPLLQENPSTDRLIRIAEEEVKKHTTLKPGDKIASVGAVLKNGLCAYTLSHQQTLCDIRNKLNNVSGLFLAGDYIEGVSIEACFFSGWSAAKSASNAFTVSKRLFEAVS